MKTASLNARRAFQLNDSSVEAARLLATIGEKALDGSELLWRRKVFELQPQSIDDGLALTRAALRAGDLGTAERTLQAMEPFAQAAPGYQAARGRLAETNGRKDEAERHWAKAAELAPEESAYQVQLAIIRLDSADEAKRKQALDVLEQLRADPKQRAAATRALIIDGGTRKLAAERLRALAAELQTFPDATFSDRLLYLEILRQLQDPGYEEYLARLEKEAPPAAADTASLISWMNTTGNMNEAIRYSATLSSELLVSWPVPLAVAEAYARLKDWKGLKKMAGEKDWGAFDFLRHAYLARALRDEDLQTAANQEWDRAQRKASVQPQTLLMLARTISAWDWQDETINLLWTLSKADDTRKEALQLLYQHYAKSGDTSGLYRVLLRSTEVAPEDLVMQNNLAQVSLLLGADLERARRIAADLAQKEPTNAAFVSTYAYSLYAKGDGAAALKAMARLSQEQQNDPSVAFYHGIILAGSGKPTEALPFLERGAQAFLLPEEKALLEKARVIEAR